MLSSNSYPKSAEFTCVYTWGDFTLILQSITRDSLKIAVNKLYSYRPRQNVPYVELRLLNSVQGFS